MKILPIKNNIQTNKLLKNKIKKLPLAIFAVSILGSVLTNNCSKITPLEEDKFEQTDSTKNDIQIDDSLKIIVHEITI